MTSHRDGSCNLPELNDAHTTDDDCVGLVIPLESVTCPICVEVIQDPFVTTCGHTFCHGCLATHLQNKKNCPLCSEYITDAHIFPNILLSKLLRGVAAAEQTRRLNHVEQVKRLLANDCPKWTLADLDNVFEAVVFKRQKLQQFQEQTTLELLMHFLEHCRQEKSSQLQQLKSHLQYLELDIDLVSKHRAAVEQSLAASTQHVDTLPPLTTHVSGQLQLPPSVTAAHGFAQALAGNVMPHPHCDERSQAHAASERCSDVVTQSTSSSMITASSLKRLRDMDAPSSLQRSSGSGGSSRTGHGSQSSSMPQTCALEDLQAMLVTKKRRIAAQFQDLQQCYIQLRSSCQSEDAACADEPAEGKDLAVTEPSIDGTLAAGRENVLLDNFKKVLSAATQYGQLLPLCEVKVNSGSGSQHRSSSSGTVSSIDFNVNQTHFATAGVSRIVRVYDCSMLLNHPTAREHLPILELSSRSTLSCLSWNKYLSSHLISSDYEGTVVLWDTNAGEAVSEYEAHDKRIWSVDFNPVETMLFASASDDGKVKLWSTNQQQSVGCIDIGPNLCCVKFHPTNPHLVAIGSAAHNVHIYDTRNVRNAVQVFRGHRKAVSYVKFLSETEVVSASTDSTLRLWDFERGRHVRTYEGHVNERNFVGLAVEQDFIACGSENNQVCVYYQSIPKPLVVHSFAEGAQSEARGSPAVTGFVSAVCWRPGTDHIVAASSSGLLRILQLAS